MNRWHGAAYRRLEGLLAEGECVVLDGGVGSEIARAGPSSPPRAQPPDTWAIYEATGRVLDVHRRYAAAGCDVISTHTWGLLGSIESGRGRRPGRTGLPAWTVATRDSVNLARQAIASAGRAGACAVAFCLNDADALLAGNQVLLSLLWSLDPPDVVLVETLTAPPDPALLEAIAEVASSGMPVWVSFRRAPTSTDDGRTSFSPVVRQLEQAGVQAVLVNCIPVTQALEALGELAAASTLPVGCYPRLDDHLAPEKYGELSRQWRQRGARIVGGCCGVGPSHIHAVRNRLTPRIPTRS